MIIKIINSTVTGRDVKFYEAVETTRKASVRICRPHFFIAFFGFGDRVTEQFGAKVTGFDNHCPNFPN